MFVWYKMQMDPVSALRSSSEKESPLTGANFCLHNGSGTQANSPSLKNPQPLGYILWLMPFSTLVCYF